MCFEWFFWRKNGLPTQIHGAYTDRGKGKTGKYGQMSYYFPFLCNRKN